MFTPYYNYREISSLAELQALYPEWQVGRMTVVNRDGQLVDNPGRFTIGRKVGPTYANPASRLDLGLGHLLIELDTAHWYEYELPLDKFQRGPFAEADVGYDARPQDSSLQCMSTALLNGRVRYLEHAWHDPVSFLPVTLWVASAGKPHLSHLVEAHPYAATHVLYYFDHEIRYGDTNLYHLFEHAVLACYVCEGASFVLAELSTAADSLYSAEQTSPYVTNFRVIMEQAQAAFQRQVGPTCPSTTAMRMYGAIRHGLFPEYELRPCTTHI